MSETLQARLNGGTVEWRNNGAVGKKTNPKRWNGGTAGSPTKSASRNGEMVDFPKHGIAEFILERPTRDELSVWMDYPSETDNSSKFKFDGK